MADENKRVLVIEDMKHWTDLLTIVLGEMGYATERAVNGEEAHAALDRGPYPLAIVDVRLVDADPDDRSGLELVREAWERGCVASFLVWSGNWTTDGIQANLGPQIPYRVVDKADIGTISNFRKVLAALLKETIDDEP